MKTHIRKSLCIILSMLTAICTLPIGLTSFAEEYPVYILGDVNYDGFVTLKDASFIQRSNVGLEIITAEQSFIGDIDGNYSCTLSDAYIIQKYALDISMEYPENHDGYRIGDIISTPSYNNTDSDTEGTDSSSDTSDTEGTDSSSDTSDTEGTDSSSDIEDTDSASDILDTDSATDSEEQPVILPLYEIQFDLNGNFEREEVFPENWVSYEDNGNMYAEKRTGVNGTTSLKISNATNGVSRITNELKGFEPLGEYKLTGKIKGTNIEADAHQDGAFIDVGSILGGNCYLGYLEDGVTKNFGRGYMIDPNNNWQKGTFDWVEVTCYFIADSNGKADIVCGLQGKGTAYFDDLNIEKVDYENEPTDKVRFEGEHVGIVVYKDDIQDLDNNKILEWIHEIDNAYVLMSNLMGGVPYNGDKVYFISSDEPYVTQYQALGSINPIKWTHKYMARSCRARCTENRKARVAFHELGHNFDRMYPWSFNSEATAEYKAAYIISQFNEGTIDPRGTTTIYSTSEYINYIKSTSSISYDNTIAARDGQYSLDAMNYILFRTSEIAGWDTVSAAFKKLSQNYDNNYSSSVGKFMYWIMTLQNTYNELHPNGTGREIYDSFPDGELDYLKSLIINNNSGYKIEQDIFAVQFKDITGNNIGFEFVPYGSAANAPNLPISKKFGNPIGWSADISYITSDIIITPVYENFNTNATISIKNEHEYTDGTEAAQGNFITATVTNPFGTYTQYRIICKTSGNIVYDSGYTQSSMQRFMLTKSGYTEIYAFVKSSDGTEIMTNSCTFNTEKSVTIYYAGLSNPYIHYRLNGEWTAVPGVAMNKTDDFPGYTYKYTVVIKNASGILVCFNDGKGNWDNNAQKNYSVYTGIYGIKNGSVTPLVK